MAGPGGRASVGAQAPAPSRGTSKTPSCLVCQRRKVKCDRNDPCSSCVKNGVECIYRAHAPPRRRRKRRLSEDAQRCPSSARDAAPGQGNRVDTPTTTYAVSPTVPQAGEGMLITGEGRSLYVDNNMWTNVSNELPNAEHVLRDLSDNESTQSHPLQDLGDETSLLVGSATRKGLAALHPSTLHIFRLWQAFLENVNPLVKILHGPTVQQQILEATGALEKVPKDFEALMFCIYCISLVSMDPADVQNSFGQKKSVLLSKYRHGARLALSNAGLLRTSSVVVLQAFFLFLLSMRAFSDPHSIWSLCAVAVRIAQRIGLHIDGSQHGLSVFETEMRRRLWLQLTILDATSAQSSGAMPQPSLLGQDVQPPANLNDSDLDPRMTERPREHTGATEMIFCLARNEFGMWLNRWSKATTPGGAPGGRRFLTSSSLPLAEKDRAINELSELFETKFLQYCDKSIPLHYMTTLLTQSVITVLQLTAHHPRQYSKAGTSISKAERDRIFSICLRVVENFDTFQTDPVMKRYAWHADNHIPWDVLIYMLSEMRRRINQEDSRKAWLLIDRTYSRYYEQMQSKPRSPLHSAVQNLILKAWRAGEEEHTKGGQYQCLPSLSCPKIVSILSEKSCLQSPDQNVPPSDQRSHLPQQQQQQQQQHQEEEEEEEEEEEDTTIPNNTQTLPSNQKHLDLTIDSNTDTDTTLSPINWAQWDDLLEQFQQQLADDEFPWMNPD